MAFPIRFSAVRAITKELSVGDQAGKPLVVGGARELAAVLRRELGRGAHPGAVRADDSPEGAAVFVYVAGAQLDEDALKRARRARVPIVAVAAPEVDSVPYVLATDVVRVPSGEGFPVATIAEVVAHRLGEDGAPLAARLPFLRRAVADELVSSFARRNGIVGAAVFRGGTDLPVLALNQVRLLLRLEQAFGYQIDLQERAPEIAATIAAGFGLRAVAREIVGLLPGAGWLVKGGVAYAGTRALGEAALLRLEAGPGSH